MVKRIWLICLKALFVFDRTPGLIVSVNEAISPPATLLLSENNDGIESASQQTTTEKAATINQFFLSVACIM